MASGLRIDFRRTRIEAERPSQEALAMIWGRKRMAVETREGYWN
jgi:hypothetical protein